MLTLTLMRHATAASGFGGGDHSRPLTELGVAEAKSIGEQLGRDITQPDLILCSDASRTQSTAFHVIEAAQWGRSPTPLASIYNAYSSDVLDAVITHARDKVNIMVIGHQPTIGQLIQHLTGERVGVPPATAVAITFDVLDWSEVHSHGGVISVGISPAR